jgi:hypothetical protein
VTFIAPPRPADTRDSGFLFGRRASKPRVRLAIADEDGARRALGTDGGLPMAALAGSSIEHLARIALG